MPLVTGWIASLLLHVYVRKSKAKTERKTVLEEKAA